MAHVKNKEFLHDFLEKKVAEYNHPSFIEKDPVSVPHRYRKKQDIEVAGLFAAIFAWGNRATIIRKSLELMDGMDDAPYDFIQNHEPRDLKRLLNFRHRTFNPTDLFYFIKFLKNHYQHSDSLETAFLPAPKTSRALPATDTKHAVWTATTDNREENECIKAALTGFYHRFFSLTGVPDRTRKHIASPEKNSTCKRLNMYLRWMVRKDKQGVDFGIWKKIKAADLICPVDLHVARVARGFGLVHRTQTDWLTAMELTAELRTMDQKDPVKYDFALFGLGVTGTY